MSKIRLGMLGLACALIALQVHGQTYPDRAVRVIVPFPAGGTIDTVGRVVAQRLSAQLGQPFVVENRGGGGGSIGTEAVARAAPDGYTLLIGTGSTHGTNSSVLKNLSYDPQRDFAPIALIASMPYILVAHPSFQPNTPGELVARARREPGKLNFASYGSGSSNHLATELFRSITGVDIVHVPYKGAAPAINDLLGGQVQFMFEVFATSGPHVRSGRLKLLGVGAAKRSAISPDTPTLVESGVQGFEAGTFAALFAPAATQTSLVTRLNGEVRQALADREVRDRLVQLGVEIEGGTPQVLADRVATEVRKWDQLVKTRNLKFD